MPMLQRAANTEPRPSSACLPLAGSQPQTVTFCGTIRAVRVKLQNGGAVEGDIFRCPRSVRHRRLEDQRRAPWPRPTAGPLDFRLAVMTLQTESSHRSTTTYEIHRLV